MAYFAVTFIAFAIVLVILQIQIEKQTRQRFLLNTLSCYSEVLAQSDDYEKTVKLLPTGLRVTILDKSDKIIYDSENSEIIGDNRADRPEVEKSHIKTDGGYDIRLSETTGQKYFYYSKQLNDRTIRVALPYKDDTKQLIHPNIWYLLIAGLLFAAALLLITLTSDRISQSIIRLLKLHIQNSDEAVAIFSPDKTLEFSNAKFIQYLSSILGKPAPDPNLLWSEHFFSELDDFQKKNSDCVKYDTLRYVGEVSCKKYRVQAVIYPDTGFEVSIDDITQLQDNTTLKKQMTSNISHELRTPVTSIMGYLETLNSCPDMAKEKRLSFTSKAYNQCVRLSELIRDMSLISKIEESPDRLSKETINLRKLFDSVVCEFSTELESKNVKIENLLFADLSIQGNNSLIHAIFRNLIENSLKYAGNDITIHIECYSQDKEQVFLTYYDTGVGVPDEHLSRLFERFYRVNEGRTRDAGGSGLGLSIVRNAVAFHGGDINVINREKGGLQFFFSLHK